MSTYIRRFIECDASGCWGRFDGPRDATNVEVRRLARAQDWTKVSGGPDTNWKPRDFCPEHPSGGAS